MRMERRSESGNESYFVSWLSMNESSFLNIGEANLNGHWYFILKMRRWKYSEPLFMERMSWTFENLDEQDGSFRDFTPDIPMVCAGASQRYINSHVGLRRSRDGRNNIMLRVAGKASPVTSGGSAALSSSAKFKGHILESWYLFLWQNSTLNDSKARNGDATRWMHTQSKCWRPANLSTDRRPGYRTVGTELKSWSFNCKLPADRAEILTDIPKHLWTVIFMIVHRRVTDESGTFKFKCNPESQPFFAAKRGYVPNESAQPESRR